MFIYRKLDNCLPSENLKPIQGWNCIARTLFRQSVNNNYIIVYILIIPRTTYHCYVIRYKYMGGMQAMVMPLKSYAPSQ
jgi:hypothetical protein